MQKFAWTRPFRIAVCVGLDCLWGMKRTVQVLAAHCVLKQSSDIVASLGTMLALALLKDREQQQQHIFTPALAKDALAQHHARHCSVCGGSKAHTYRLARTYAHTHAHKHIHTRMRTHTHIQTQTRANTHRCAHKHAHAHAQTHRHTHGRTYKRPNTQAHTRAHMHVHTHANTHTCICMHMLLA